MFALKDGILSMPYVQKHLDDPFFVSSENEQNELYKTIRFNKNFVVLSQALPKANYSLPYLKPIDKNSLISELKIHKKGSMSSSGKKLKFPRIREKNFKGKKKFFSVQKSLDSPRLLDHLSEPSDSADSGRNHLKKKKKLESFFKNCQIDMVSY